VQIKARRESWMCWQKYQNKFSRREKFTFLIAWGHATTLQWGYVEPQNYFFPSNFSHPFPFFFHEENAFSSSMTSIYCLKDDI